jgi:hypothetical protein
MLLGRSRLGKGVNQRAAVFPAVELDFVWPGAPFPVSRSDFKLSRKIPHLALQWCMNSTGSFQPWCLKRTMVQSPSCLSSQLTFVPIHSSGPSTTCHSTRLPGSSSRTFMSKPPLPKRNWSTPPTLLSPCVSVVRHPERPSTGARAAPRSPRVAPLTRLKRRHHERRKDRTPLPAPTAVLGVNELRGGYVTISA